MASIVSKIDVSGLTSNLVAQVKIVGVNRLVWRCRIGSALIRLAVWVIGCKVEE